MIADKNLIRSVKDWLWEVDTKLRYTYASPQIKGILGYEPEEIIGLTPFDLMRKDEGERVAALF